MKKLSFEELPDAVMELNRKLDILLAEYSTKPAKDGDYLMPMEDFLIYLPEQPAKQTVYDWIFKRKVPFEKYGRRIYFRKSQIDNWLASGRQINKCA